MPKIEYACDRCRAPLESPLEEAGDKFPCPTCGHPLVVPGVEKLKRHREDEARKAAEKARAAAVPAAPPKPAVPVPARAAVAPKAEVPEYESIVRGAALIEAWASVCIIVGALAVVIAVVGAVAFFGRGALDPAAMVGAGAALGAALGCFVLAVLLKMVAALSLAIRDLAINSF